jgi:hypothetical protein
MNERLTVFHERTQAAAARAAMRKPEAVVNLGFITSGRQFTQTTPASSPELERARIASPSTKRLEAFHDRTAAAIAAAAKAGALAGLR